MDISKLLPNIPFLMLMLHLSDGQQNTYPRTSLYRACRSASPVLLPCSRGDTTDGGAGRAGKLVLDAYPTDSCNVTVTVPLCADWQTQNKYALYINFFSLTVLYGDSVEFYRGNDTLVKNLTRSSRSSPISVTSFAQYLTAYSREPSLEIRFIRNAELTQSDHLLDDPIILDFIVLREKKVEGTFLNPWELYCPALRGYIPRDKFCEPGNRINCPAEYSPNVGRNPAKGKETGQAYDCTAPSTRATPTVKPWRPLSYSKPWDFSDFSDSEMTAIICGILLGVLLVVMLICWGCQRFAKSRPGAAARRPRRSVQEFLRGRAGNTQTGRRNGQQAPAVRYTIRRGRSNVAIPIGTPIVSTVSRDVDAPPAYEEIFPTPAAPKVEESEI
ncbi:hypothetical protein BV898_17924 [Hypsibius exemplaris]|uniref:CUB domain-containing protein n=1 Tax=Hypsibius exemplaris TaxID=2072580 RepID=A0A9X6RN07_HYPEX|nr:hypothetical protein BV898_17924 [Hypsibius exemplaris]